LFDVSPGLAELLSRLDISVSILVDGFTSVFGSVGFGGDALFWVASISLETAEVISEPAFLIVRTTFPKVLATSVILPGPSNISASIKINSISKGPIPKKSISYLYHAIFFCAYGLRMFAHQS
jgi:hypothetical protein